MSTSRRVLLFLVFTVLLVVVLAGLAVWAPRAYTAEVDHIHSSSRFDRSPALLHRQLLRFAGSRATVVTVTEVQERPRARALRVRGWRKFTPSGTDLGIVWDRSVWRLRHHRVARVTRLSYRQWNGYVVRPRVAAVLLVRRSDGFRLLVTNIHMPSGVYARHGFADQARGRVWSSSLRGLGSRVRVWSARWDPDGVLVAGDWNVDLKNPRWRLRVWRALPFLSPTWGRPFPRGGTWGRYLYDGSLTNLGGRARLIGDDGSSDHRPYREVLG